MIEERKSTSSISSRSQRPSTVWPERRHWAVGAICGLLLAAILIWPVVGGSQSPEIRIAGTSRALSVLVVDGDARILLLNANGPQDARSAIGTLNRLWESEPSIIVVGADRKNGEALWEALQRLRPRQLIVAGAPGGEPEWIMIERYCKDAGIEISYLEEQAAIQLPSIKLTIMPPDSARDAPSWVEVQSGTISAAIGLGGLPDIGRRHLAITDARNSTGTWSDVQVLAGQSRGGESGRSIGLGPGERINVILEPDRIRIQGRPAHDALGY